MNQIGFSIEFSNIADKRANPNLLVKFSNEVLSMKGCGSDVHVITDITRAAIAVYFGDKVYVANDDTTIRGIAEAVAGIIFRRKNRTRRRSENLLNSFAHAILNRAECADRRRTVNVKPSIDDRRDVLYREIQKAQNIAWQQGVIVATYK